MRTKCLRFGDWIQLHENRNRKKERNKTVEITTIQIDFDKLLVDFSLGL